MGSNRYSPDRAVRTIEILRTCRRARAARFIIDAPRTSVRMDNDNPDRVTAQEEFLDGPVGRTETSANDAVRPSSSERQATVLKAVVRAPHATTG